MDELMKQNIWLLGGLAVVIIAGMTIWGQDRETREEQSASMMVDHEPVGGIGELDPDQLAAEQLAANQAAWAELGEKPYQGPVTERPAFVSSLEWRVLKNVAQQHPNTEQELTRLVNHLRFAKQWDLWHEIDPQDQTRRSALGEQLLLEIPDRVKNQELDVVHAQQMQESLLMALIPDVTERRQRAAQEAARIGVQFRVEGDS